MAKGDKFVTKEILALGKVEGLKKLQEVLTLNKVSKTDSERHIKNFTKKIDGGSKKRGTLSKIVLMKKESYAGISVKALKEIKAGIVAVIQEAISIKEATKQVDAGKKKEIADLRKKAKSLGLKLSKK